MYVTFKVMAFYLLLNEKNHRHFFSLSNRLRFRKIIRYHTRVIFKLSNCMVLSTYKSFILLKNATNHFEIINRCALQEWKYAN